MSAHPHRAKGGERARLVTKAPATAEQTAADRARWSATEDDGGPSPTSRADAMGSTILAYLITGPILFGGIGWLVDRWLGVTGFIAVGILAGMALSLYIIWLRYGTSQAPHDDDPAEGSTTAAQPHNEENP
ncbi:AtpZ/AtpI family protein [Janibacter sp. G349]|uniref:AtpZ/AtpI family protein n=1 Tax=unclassified Janibacter TaxID=2649294 RepID=UPI003B80BAE5